MPFSLFSPSSSSSDYTAGHWDPSCWVEVGAADSSGHLPSLCDLDGRPLLPAQQQVMSMDPRLLRATMFGDVNSLKELVMEDPKILLGKTKQGNTALHLSANLGHEDFTRELCACSPLLALSMVNQAGETPLHCAATCGHLGIVRLLIRKVNSSPCLQKWDDRTGKWVEYPILRMTKWSGDTALQDALRNGHPDVAKELWNADRELSRVVNKCGESILYFAVLEKLTEMVRDLSDDLSTPCRGPAGDTALHAAIAVGDLETAKLLLTKMHRLINEPNTYGNTPLHYAAMMDKVEFVQFLMDNGACLCNLNSDGFSPVHLAAGLGHMRIFKALIRHCSDSGSILTGPRQNAYNSDVSSEGAKSFPSSSMASSGSSTEMAPQYRINLSDDDPLGNAPSRPKNVTAAATLHASFASRRCLEVTKNVLHIAIECGKLEVVEYILTAPELRGIVNQPDGDGNWPLHLAALRCNPKIVRALLKDRRTRITKLNRHGETALQFFYSYVEPTVTIQWNETLVLLNEAIPNHSSLLKRNDAQTKLMEKVTEEIRTLQMTYANNTTIVSVLMATVTFAAAFTVPGGYISDSGSHPGLPILLQMPTFKLFLITNTIALCSSLAVSFLYIYASKGDVEFFLHYRRFTTSLMWIAFIAMALAFASGMYTVVAPGCLWLAIVICVLCACLPCLTGVLHIWPSSIRNRLRKRSPLDLAQML